MTARAPARGSGATVAVVAAGAGARGAFEAGALSVLLPWLDGEGYRPQIFVGTSAGAINAALLAAFADLPAHKAADRLIEFWQQTTLPQIVRSPARSLPGLAWHAAGQVFGYPKGGVASLFDSSPMLGYAAGVFGPLADQLQAGFDEKKVRALALAATDRAQRTRVFCQLAGGSALPPSSASRAIDYQQTTITHQHVLASSAIPAVFRPIEVAGEWFTDGGTRLNVPLSPAVALGAKHVVVVATHPAAYPAAAAATSAAAAPDALDSVAAAVGALLSDRMIEDLHTLDKLNRIADAAPPGAGGPKRIGRLFVGPSSRQELAVVAAEAYAGGNHGLTRIFTDQLGFIHRLLGSRQPGTSDILSYLFFDPAFVEPAIARGQQYAADVIAGPNPWQ